MVHIAFLLVLAVWLLGFLLRQDLQESSVEHEHLTLDLVASDSVLMGWRTDWGLNAMDPAVVDGIQTQLNFHLPLHLKRYYNTDQKTLMQAVPHI